MNHPSAAQFVQENLKTLFAYSLSRVSSKEDAEDLTSDIVLAILQQADKLKNPDAFYGYVWSIAANTYRKFLTKKNRFIFEEIDANIPDDSDFTDGLYAREEATSLRREIALLSKEYRECTVAYYYDELSCAEISKKLNISLDMVKYYLFKTRKILKEGICMEREFGEKSFRPAPFEFRTIFSGNFNQEYRYLFARKLPGQILMSAYYTPMTIRELAIELGVASVYLEDELNLLQTYNFITRTPSGKYQTNLLIFTDDFTREFHKTAAKSAEPILRKIISGFREKLSQIRALNPVCEKLSDSRLLWALLWPSMRQGHDIFSKHYPDFQEESLLYDGATGINYGFSTDEPDYKFSCISFAGYAKIDENYYACAADFGILPESNRYFEHTDPQTFRNKVYHTISMKMEPEFMILTEAEEKKLLEILSPQSSLMAEVYHQLFICALQLMHIHAPSGIRKQVDRIVFQTLLFRTVGLIGGYAVTSGALSLPDFDGPAAIYVRENTKEAEASIYVNCGMG